MNPLVFHILKKDLVHLRGLLIGWFLLLIAQSSLIGFGLTTGAGDYFWQIAYGFLAIGIPVAQSLLVMVLIPMLVHAEPLVGTTAYWFTRPIGRKTLLCSKIVFVCLLLIVPNFVLECLVLAVNRIPLADILSLMPEILIQQLSTLLFFAGFAVLTSGFANYALWVVVAVVVTSVVGFVAQMFVIWQSAEAFFQTTQNPTLLASRFCASGTFQILGGLMVVSHQYLTRETKSSVCQWVAVLAISSVISFAWPWDFLDAPKIEVSREVIPSDSVVVMLEEVSGSDSIQLFSSDTPETEVSMRIRFDDVPDGVQLEVGKATGSVQFESETLEVNSTNSSMTFGGSRFWPAAVQHSLGGVPVLNARGENDTTGCSLFSLPTEKFVTISQETGALNLQLDLVAYRYTPAGSVPLQSGEEIVTPESRVEIGSVLKSNSGCTLIVRERRLNRWFGAVRESPYDFGSPRRIYLLVNRKENQAVLPEENYGADMLGAFQAASRLINRSFSLAFDGTDLGDRFELSDEWLEEAQFVILDRTEIGTLQRPLVVEDFVMDEEKACGVPESGDSEQER